MQSVRILIVATTAATKRLYEELFRRYIDQGLSLEFAESGVVALQRLGTEADPAQNANLLLIPAELPILSPHEFVRAIRESPRLRSIPIVVFTHGLGEEAIRRLYQEGANTIMQTPLGFSEMEKVIEAFAHIWLRLAYLPFPGGAGTRAWDDRP